MSTSKTTIAYILEQVGGAGDVRARSMFGEYALYCDDKIVGLVCDDQLYLKQTEAIRTVLAEPVVGEPFPGAKNFYRLDDVDDRQQLSRLVRLTADALPVPEPKKRR